jgi:hypothetical protein
MRRQSEWILLSSGFLRVRFERPDWASGSSRALYSVWVGERRIGAVGRALSAGGGWIAWEEPLTHSIDEIFSRRRDAVVHLLKHAWSLA